MTRPAAIAAPLAVAARTPVVNRLRLGLLGLNLGLWTLIVVVVRTLYA